MYWPESAAASPCLSQSPPPAGFWAPLSCPVQTLARQPHASNPVRNVGSFKFNIVDLTSEYLTTQ